MRQGQRLSELIRFRAPEGFHAAVISTAKQDGLSLSAYLRRLAFLDLSRRQAQGETVSQPMTAYDGPHGLIAA